MHAANLRLTDEGSRGRAALSNSFLPVAQISLLLLLIQWRKRKSYCAMELSQGILRWPVRAAFTSKLHTSKFHIAHFQIPHCTLPNSTLHTLKCQIVSWKNFQKSTRATVDTTNSLSGVLSSLSCSHPDNVLSDSATARDNKEALRLATSAKNKDVALTCFSAHATSLVFAASKASSRETRQGSYIIYCELGKPSQEASRPTYKRELQLCRPSNLPVLRHLIRLVLAR